MHCRTGLFMTALLLLTACDLVGEISDVLPREHRQQVRALERMAREAEDIQREAVELAHYGKEETDTTQGAGNQSVFSTDQEAVEALHRQGLERITLEQFRQIKEGVNEQRRQENKPALEDPRLRMVVYQAGQRRAERELR